jgi:hypothetical protein
VADTVEGVAREEGPLDRRFLRRAKAFLIELTAFVSLLLVLIKIIMTEAQHLFR